MAPSMTMASYESTQVINVSQNAVSSPVGKEDENGTHPDDVLVEDSMKHMYQPNQGGAVQPSQQEADDDDEELYDVSPKAKASFEAAKFSARNLDAAPDAVLNGGPVGGTKPVTRNKKPGKPPANAIDDLLANGATPRACDPEGQRSKMKSIDGAAPTGKQANRSAGASPGPANTKSSQQPPPVSRKAALPPQNGTSARTSQRPASMKATTVPTSARAALYAKKHGLQPEQQLAINTEPAIAVTRKLPTGSSKRSPLRERSKNMQTPARKAAEADAANIRPATGKAQSRKHGMFAQTPVVRPSNEQSAAQGKKSMDSFEVDGDTAVVGRNAGQGKGKAKDKASNSIPPSKGSMASKTAPKRLSTYDFPDDSPPPVKPTRQAERSAADGNTATKKSAAACKTGTVNAMEADTVKGRRGRPKKATKARDSSHPPSETPGIRKQPSRHVKGRSKETTANPNRDDDEDEEAAPVAHKSPPRVKRDMHAHKSRRRDGTIEDFEDAVVDYDIDEQPPRAAVEGRSSAAAQQSARTSEDPPRTKEQHEQREAVQPPGQGAKVGASQDNAITLSDREASSSPAPSTPVAASTAPAAVSTITNVKKEGARAPRTPAIFQSSPPAAAKGTGGKPDIGIVDVEASRRSTIIGFDRSGPRNQGTLSAKNSATGSARTNHTSIPPRKVPLASEAGSTRGRLLTRRGNGPSSVATSMRSTRTTRAAPPSNVAEDVRDALAGFFTKSVKHQPTPFRQSNGRESENRPISEAQRLEYDQDDGFTTLVDDAPADAEIHAASPTTVRELRGSSAAPAALQTAMPPPAPKAAKIVSQQRAPTVPSMLTLENALSGSLNSANHTSKANAKRKADDGTAQQPEAKRRKAADAASAAPSRPNAKPTVSKTPPIAPKQQSMTTKIAAGPKTQSTRRVSRKATRHASQGNVDIHGSPIPRDLDVPDNSTALEAFSQLAQLSSDEAPADRTTVTAPPTAKITLANPTCFDEILVVPSHQPEALSSNEKRRPASPREDSQAITAVVFGKVDSKKLIIRDETALPPTDPFTSSEGARKEPSKENVFSNLIEGFRQQVAQPERKRRRSVDEEDDPEKTLVEPEPEPKPKRSKIRARASSEDSGAVSDVSEDEEPDTRGIGDWRTALQPHQLNLFDELVSTSHKLVRHLVGHETAMREQIQAYRRNGLKLIEEAERAQAHEYQMSLQKLQQRKKQLSKGLNHVSEKLKAAVSDVHEARAERAARVKDVDEEERRLKAMVPQYC